LRIGRFVSGRGTERARPQWVRDVGRCVAHRNEGSGTQRESDAGALRRIVAGGDGEFERE